MSIREFLIREVGKSVINPYLDAQFSTKFEDKSCQNVSFQELSEHWHYY